MPRAVTGSGSREFHIPTYQFCGPGTKTLERIAQGQKGKNDLDRLCLKHDLSYQSTSDGKLRRIADKELEEEARKLVKSKNHPASERAVAWLVANAMKLKRKIGFGLKFPESQQRSPNRRRPPPSSQQKKKKTTKKPLKKGKPSVVAAKRGGFLPLLVPIASTLAALLGGGSAVAKTIMDAKKGIRDSEETKRHNVKMEQIAGGEGVFIRPYRSRNKSGSGAKNVTSGKGVFIRPYRARGKSGSGAIQLKTKN
ncbi:Hypothetical protein NTJ_08493 [Nesidiocoris tenuis]|uniref:Phospholipase A2-like domain-containing protein n=1 Tax=Nesidiocoris tenuis TaxID=355587 RepID=A0ABN7AU18_9HEMI|nr:Hypothetical protein NTJ_08493 [Nesidiocoris tenuis]